jgi:plasmid stabilization system protein ParE
MAREVEWAEAAVAGLVDAIAYIARDSPTYAATLAVSADRAAASLTELPHRGRRVGEYNDPDVRELIVNRAYRLIYRVGKTTVTVIAFVHAARDLSTFVAARPQ